MELNYSSEKRMKHEDAFFVFNRIFTVKSKAGKKLQPIKTGPFEIMR